MYYNSGAGPGGSQTIMSGIKIPRSHTQHRDLSFFFFKDSEFLFFHLRESIKIITASAKKDAVSVTRK